MCFIDDQTRLEDWRYIGEGALNVVFSTTVPFNGSHTPLALRIVKSEVSDSSRVERMDSLRRLFAKLFSEGTRAVIPEVQTVLVSGKFCYELVHRAELQNLRPKKRVEKWPCSMFAWEREVKAFVMRDLTSIEGCSNSLCFELKPKWGFLGNGSNACRFCMHQVYKLKHGEIDQISHYCPLALFSKDRQRKKESIENLRQCPQNNLKVFLNGTSIDLSSVSEYFWNVLLDVLVQEQSVLEKIREIQLKDYMDIRNLFPLLSAQHIPLDSISNGIFDEIWTANFLSRISESQTCTSDLDDYKSDSSSSIIEAAQDFLISMTAKDLSVMVTIGFEEPYSSSLESSLQTQHCIGLVDIDFKPPSKLAHWFELDRDIRETFKASEFANKKCVP